MTMQKIEGIINSVMSATDIPEDRKRNILEQLNAVTRPLETDPWIYRMVVLCLGLTVLATVIGGIVLTYIGGSSPNFQIPQGVVAIGSAAVGALAGLLAPSPRQS